MKHAEVAIKELLSEHGRQYATVEVAASTPLPPSSVESTFDVDEAQVEVGTTFTGNKAPAPARRAKA